MLQEDRNLIIETDPSPVGIDLRSLHELVVDLGGCLSLLAQPGEPISDLQALAGHATATFTLQRYTYHYDASASRTLTLWVTYFPAPEL